MRNLIPISLLFMLLGSCNDDDKIASCGETICTLDLRSIMVSLRDDSDMPVALDTFKVIIKNSNEDITIEANEDEMNYFRQQGLYPIFNDSFQAKYENKEETIVFTGSKDGQDIVSRQFVVGADCCHVGLIEGELLIILND